MSESTTKSARVVKVAAGVENTDGMTQVAHHESSVDGVSWAASMDVTLRKVG
jgi:uncharacterized protein (DUF2235 family)